VLAQRHVYAKPSIAPVSCDGLCATATSRHFFLHQLIELVINPDHILRQLKTPLYGNQRDSLRTVATSRLSLTVTDQMYNRNTSE